MILTKRPEGMSFSEYKRLRREQTLKDRRMRKHGALIYIASQIITDPLTKIKSKRTFMPAVKTFDRRGNVQYKAMERKQLS